MSASSATPSGTRGAVVAPSITDLVENCPTLGTLPSVYHRITEVMCDPYSSSGDFGAVVSEDPGLTARLLRLVNSAFYNVPSEIDSVTQALSVIGTEQLYDLVLATSVISMFNDVPAELVDMESFWRHSLATGVTCRVLATERGEANVERLFVAGLLHDIGRLLMFMGNPKESIECMRRAQDEGHLVYKLEEERMGYDHAKVGQALLNAWRLPDSLQEPVEFHHDPKNARRFGIDAAIVHVADITAHSLLLGHSGEQHIPPLSDAAWYRVDGAISISPATFAEIEIQYSAAVRAILGD